MINRTSLFHRLATTVGGRMIWAAFLSILFLSACTESSSTATNAPFPTYRLTTSFTGDDRALSVVNSTESDATEGLQIPTELKFRATANDAQQRWKFVKSDDGTFTIHNQAIGDGYSLDVINDGVLNRVTMAPTANVSGQYWTITPKDNGFCQLTNDFTGSEIALDVNPDGDQDEPMLAPAGAFTGQQWRFQINNNGVSTDETILACLQM